MSQFTKIFRLSITCFVFLSISSSTLYSQTEKVDKLYKQIITYFGKNKPDSAIICLSNYQLKKDLTNTERFWGQLFYAQILTEKGNFKKGYQEAKKAIALLKPTNVDANSLKANAYNLIGNSYFTKQQFDSAFYYCNWAKLHLSPKDDYTSASNYEILGYVYYLRKQFKLSLDEYNKALTFYLNFKKECDVLDLKSKIAKVQHKLNNNNMAYSIICNAIAKADSCGNLVIKQSCLSTYFEFLFNDKKYKEAIDIKLKIDSINTKINIIGNDAKFNELDVKYQSKFKEQENKNLKLINSEKEKTLSKQKIALISSIIAIFLFISLSYFLFKISTQRKKNNELLQTQKLEIDLKNKELERLNVLNQKIFSVISHDFKGPIMSLKLLLSKDEFLKSEHPTVAAYVNDIGLQLNQSNDMLDSLLEWAKTELLINNTNTNTTNLLLEINNTVEQLQHKLNEKHIVINLSIPFNTAILFPNTLFKIVFRNILNNAIKFSNPQSNIQITYTNNQLLISDEGKGIDEKKIRKLFTNQVSPGLGTNNESGFGLGLYLCFELMQKNGGSISVKNNIPNKGSTFTIHF